MNIIQLQDRLKDLSDQQLQKEMQNPTGSSPQYLVLTELKRRKDMRDSYMSEAEQGQANQPPMSEQYSQPQMPPQGLAQGMPQQPNMAQAPQAPQPGQMPQQFAAGGRVGPYSQMTGTGYEIPAQWGTGAPTRTFYPSPIPQNPYAGMPYGSPQRVAMEQTLRERHEAELRLQNGQYGPQYGSMATEMPAPGSLPSERAMAGQAEIQSGVQAGMIPPFNNPPQDAALGQTVRDFFDGPGTYDYGQYGSMETEMPAPGSSAHEQNMAKQRELAEARQRLMPPERAPISQSPIAQFIDAARSHDYGQTATDIKRWIQGKNRPDDRLGIDGPGTYDYGEMDDGMAPNDYGWTPPRSQIAPDQVGPPAAGDGTSMFTAPDGTPVSPVGIAQGGPQAPGGQQATGGPPKSTRTSPPSAPAGSSASSDYITELGEDLAGRQSEAVKLQAKIDGMGGDLEKQRSSDLGMAMAQAGFAMASGDSPYFAQNIGAGGTAGLNAAQASETRRGDIEAKRMGLQMDAASSIDRFGLGQGEQQARLANLMQTGSQFEKTYAFNEWKAKEALAQGDIENSMKWREVAQRDKQLALSEKELMRKLPTQQAKNLKALQDESPEAYSLLIEYNNSKTMYGAKADKEELAAKLFTETMTAMNENAVKYGEMSEEDKRALAKKNVRAALNITGVGGGSALGETKPDGSRDYTP